MGRRRTCGPAAAADLYQTPGYVTEAPVTTAALDLPTSQGFEHAQHAGSLPSRMTAFDHCMAQALLAQVATEQVVPGVAGGVAIAGAPIWCGAHGWRDLEQRLPVTVDTPFRWYSISKPLTALAVQELACRGVVDLDAPVCPLVPGLCFTDPHATALASLRDCLLHRTGLSGGNWTWHGAPPVREELLARIPHLPCRQGLRTGFHYQNLHFSIIDAVLEAQGHDWHGLMQDLLGPLGVHPLTDLAGFQASPRALGYGPLDLSPPRREDDFDFAAAAPASAVCGNVRELTAVAALAARGGTGGDWLSQRAFAAATTPQHCLAPRPWPELQAPAACLAGEWSLYRGEPLLRWAGGFTGWVSHLLALPGRGVAACALANRGSSDAAETLAYALLDRAAGWEPLPWPERYLALKKSNRSRGDQRLREALARTAAPWPIPVGACYGSFHHPAYGGLTVLAGADGPRLRFRLVELPLLAQSDGIRALGRPVWGGEIFWQLAPEITDGRVVAWHFNPDDPGAPLRFVREQ